VARMYSINVEINLCRIDLTYVIKTFQKLRIIFRNDFVEFLEAQSIWRILRRRLVLM
jgi:hypothetical protein